MEEEFEEEEVWAMRKERKNDSPKTRKLIEASLSSSSSSRRLSSTPRKTRRSVALGEEGSGSNLRQSAPVNIPEWSKVYKQSNLSGAAGAEGDDAGDEEEEDDVEEKVPPHEWIAKRLARSQISSSVCEGAGRTLKGRDQRKVRDAVLTKTGFLE